MKKWEYMLAEFHTSRGSMLHRLNGLGQDSWKEINLIKNFIPTVDTCFSDFIKKAGGQGWEAVNMVKDEDLLRFLFKREL